VTVTTGADGTVCTDELGFGDYTVTEQLPTGYVADGPLAKSVTVDTNSECGDGNEATVGFANTPLTNVTVSVDSQVNGGTASTINCDWAAPDNSAVTGADGDGSLTRSDLLPGTYTCTVVIDP
jgi:uncharacterized surface anchored protein